MLGGIKARLIFLVVPVAVAACDSVASHYETLEEARADRLFERGWLPDVLPPSSYDITVENDLDLNTSQGEFSFSPSEFAQLRDRLSPLGTLADSGFSSVLGDVESHVAEGYPAFGYRQSEYEWVFLCMPERGHCRYRLQ